MRYNTKLRPIFDSFIGVRLPIYNRYGFDKNKDRLVDSKDVSTRRKIAESGYGVDKLVDDSDELVRVAVAKSGYALDKLVDDDSPLVREAVYNNIK